MSDLKVVELQSSNFRDIPATLRNIAKSIEDGDCGDVSCVALVSIGQQTDVFHAGEGDVADAMFCLQMGIHKLCAVAHEACNS